jgi:uncharacterized membrane protein YadS
MPLKDTTSPLKDTTTPKRHRSLGIRPSCRAVLARLGRVTWLAAMTAMMWIASARLALAQTDEPEEKKYTMPYILVILTIAIALVVVLKPAARGTEIKLRPYDE